MKVFRVTNDVNRYQYFLPEHEEDWQRLVFDCQPRLSDWTAPAIFIYKPKHKAGDFYQFNADALITSPHATDVLRFHLEMAGELLPLFYEGEEYTILNITECINCLDSEKTRWERAQKGKRLWPNKYVFHPDRFSESMIFKIPETCKAEVLLVEGLHEPEYEFRNVVLQAGLTGLVFEELWSHGERRKWFT